MRLRILLDNQFPSSLPFNYQEHLAAAVYRLLATSDKDYSRFLHDDGYKLDGGPKTFKMFAFSWLRGPRLSGGRDTVRFAPGIVEWLVASPVPDFLQHCATGLLAEGCLHVGRTDFPIQTVEALPDPPLGETSYFTCLSPIVAGVPSPDDRPARYLRPTETEAFSAAVRNNLLRKHQVLHGRAPDDTAFALEFKPEYLSRDTHAGTKKITTHGIDIIGAFAPFKVTGSIALMQLGLESGFGEKNPSGFGMAEVER